MKVLQLTMVAGERENEDEILTEITTPVAILNPEKVIRNFYPRKPLPTGQTRVGTRVLFTNGNAIAVTDLYEDIIHRLHLLA